MTSPLPLPLPFLAGRSAFQTALNRLRPLIRWAAHSAVISLVGIPQTFSV